MPSICCVSPRPTCSHTIQRDRCRSSATVLPLAELRQRPHWSFSRINALVNYCSLAWAFKYVYRKEPAFTAAAPIFGGVFHSALAFYFVRQQQGQTCPSSDCLELFAELFSESFLPNDCSWECTSCPYSLACQTWHRDRARTFVHIQHNNNAA